LIQPQKNAKNTESIENRNPGEGTGIAGRTILFRQEQLNRFS